MKTQLLEDFDESGSAPSKGAAPAAPPAAPIAPDAPAAPVTQTAAQAAAQVAAPADAGPAVPVRPAVWQRPRQVEAAAAEPAPAVVEAPPVQAPVRPRGFAPQPTASGTTTVPLGDITAPAWPQGTAPGGDPDWLRERLARDAAVRQRTEWDGMWKRRLASWGAAGVLLALLAGGGLWLYEQSRVEGALVVVANTNPAPEAHALRPAGLQPPAAPAAPAVEQVAPESAGTAAVGGTAGPLTGSGAGSGTGSSTGSSTGPGPDPAPTVDTAAPQTPAFADRTVVPVATDVPPAAKPKHKRSRVSRHSEPEARADVREGERSYRQRYEETMMQCRAHGYDERQCLQRGCEMTKYGFACKG
jgi:hypothetical protein